MTKSGACAIVGLGFTSQQGRVPGKTAVSFQLEAARNALEDAGVAKEEVDGLCWETPPTDPGLDGYRVAELLGIDGQVRFVSQFPARGTSAGSAIMQAVMAVQSGVASCVLCVAGDNSRSGGTGEHFHRGRDIGAVYGMFGAVSMYAMHAQRHMYLHGTTPDDLAAVALTFREHAQLNPRATLHGLPLTKEVYFETPFIVEPLRRPDCCLISDCGRAVVVTSAERARSLRQRPVLVLGMAQGNGEAAWGQLDGERCAQRAYGMAGVGPGDIDYVSFYDCFSIAVLMQLEDFGFCRPGEAGAFVREGNLRLGGKLPANTHGGLLSEIYLQGWPGVSEAIVQVRGAAGERQAKDAEVGLAIGISGTHTVCLVLARG